MGQRRDKPAVWQAGFEQDCSGRTLARWRSSGHRGLFQQAGIFPDVANIRFHYGYAIKSVIAIAPPDGQYKPAEQWRTLNDLNYLTLQGANDAAVSSFAGSRQYDHVQFSGNVPAFKSELYYLPRNHGQFNTMWGRASDQEGLLSWFLDLRPLLTGDEQRQVAKVYIPAFSKPRCMGALSIRICFAITRRAARWLPKTIYLNRYQDQTYKLSARSMKMRI